MKKQNKIIAEFMGGQKVLNDRDVYNMPTHDNLCYGLEEMHYKSSWYWLLPVVHKIKEIDVDFDVLEAGLSIDEVYKEVIEFIKTLNK